jgi:UDP-N-acetylglucosamine--N-acetylmuramyl-(pentapeptide) pyrophosphoryl-undecaprenol N-acetylglucosamine transferase
LQWEEQKQILEGTVVGPIFPKITTKPRDGGFILVAGGTHGHKPLFDALARSDLHNIVLQTGKVDPEPYIKMHPEWTVFTVTNEFNEYLAGAQLVVTHLGVTVLEAIVHKKPVVIVPNPEWTRTGGLKDAEHLAKKVNGVLVSEINLDGILEAIEEARNRKVPDLPDGAQTLANTIIKFLEKRLNQK